MTFLVNSLLPTIQLMLFTLCPLEPASKTSHSLFCFLNFESFYIAQVGLKPVRPFALVPSTSWDFRCALTMPHFQMGLLKDEKEPSRQLSEYRAKQSY